MRKNQLKSQFIFNRSQRIGILLLMTIIIGLLYMQQVSLFSLKEPSFTISSEKITAIQLELDSLRLAEIERRKPKIYPFNPNFITDYKAYALGMSTEEFDRLKSFREKDQWINSTNDFKRVTKTSDSLLAVISPYFKFPDWVVHPKKNSYYKKPSYKELPFGNKKDLNTATAIQLQEVPGIGEAYSQRIVAYREKIDGFAALEELHAVWGLKPEVIEKVAYQFAVKTPRLITKYNINAVSASDLATIPGVSFDLAKEIWEFVRLREGVASIDELSKIPQLSQRKLQLIRLYLYVE